MKIGITGATGQLGTLVVRALKEKTATENLIALVRTPAKAVDLAIEARAFDYTQPDVEALQGVETLLLISGNEIGQRAQQHQNVIDAAKNAGVKRLVYTSLLHADTSSLLLAPEHLATENALKVSGIPHTILRNGWYTENYTSSVAGAVKSGTVAGSAGDGKISSATRQDYAEAAAVVLTNGGHDGKVYELAGDNYYTLADLAAELSKQTGKAITYQNLTEQQYADALIGLGLPEPLAKAFASFDTGASKNDLYDESKALSGLIGRATTPLSTAVKLALG